MRFSADRCPLFCSCTSVAFVLSPSPSLLTSPAEMRTQQHENNDAPLSLICFFTRLPQLTLQHGTYNQHKCKPSSPSSNCPLSHTPTISNDVNLVKGQTACPKRCARQYPEGTRPITTAKHKSRPRSQVQNPPSKPSSRSSKTQACFPRMRRALQSTEPSVLFGFSVAVHTRIAYGQESRHTGSAYGCWGSVRLTDTLTR